MSKQDPIDHVDTVNGESVGSNVEPDVEEENQEPVAAKEEPEATQEPEPKEPPPEDYRKKARDEIYNRANEERQQEVAAGTEQGDEFQKQRALRMTLEASGISDEEIRARLEAAGEDPDLEKIVKEATQKPEPAPGKPKAYDPVAALASGEETVKIKVYGKERTLPRDEALKLAVAALQKDVAADVRHQELSTYEANLKDYENRLTDLRTSILAGRTSTAAPVTAGKTAAVPPSGAQIEMDEAEYDRVADAVYSGDRTRFSSALKDLIGKARLAGEASTVPTEQVVEQAVQKVETRIRDQALKDQRQAANRVFQDEYSDLVDDEILFVATQAQVRKIMAAEPSLTPVEVARKAGKAVRARFGDAAVKPTPKADALEARTERKRQAVSPPTVQGKAPAPPASTPESNADYVAKLQRRHGARIG